MVSIDTRRFVRTAQHVSRAVMSEVAGIGVLAAHWPAGLFIRENGWRGQQTRTLPVLLASGWGATKTTWRPLASRLAHDGFAVRAVHFNPLKRVADLAEQLEAHAHELMDETASDHVAIVGHSMGGVIARYAVCRGELGHRVPFVATVGSPHRGTPLAHLAVPLTALIGPTAAADMRPDAELVAELDAARGGEHTVWVGWHSPVDELVPAWRALLPEDGSLAGPVTNVRLNGVGHAGLVLDPRFISRVRHELAAVEANLPVAA